MKRAVFVLLLVAMPVMAKPFFFEVRGSFQIYYDEIKNGGLQDVQHPFTIRISAGLKQLAGIFYLYGDVIDDSLQLIAGFGGKLGPVFGVFFPGVDTLRHENSYVEKFRVGLEGGGLMIGLNVLNRPTSVRDTTGVDNIFTLFGGLTLFTVKPFSLWIGAERIPLKSDYNPQPKPRIYAALNVRF